MAGKWSQASREQKKTLSNTNKTECDQLILDVFLAGFIGDLRKRFCKKVYISWLSYKTPRLTYGAS